MKKKWSIRNWGIVFWSLVLVTAVGYLIYIKTRPVKQTETNTLTIALVNEDSSSDFNGQNYNLGQDFVNLVSNDNSYNWQVVSRSVADNAFKDGSVDAVIYLPQSFSSDILTFQNINPTKANIEYKVQSQTDQLTTATLQKEIVDVLYTFNQNVVEMYYSSVANSLAEAENHMNASLNNQENFVSDLTSNVQTPVQNLIPQYTTLISSTNSLNSLNQANTALQNNFFNSSTTILKQTGSNLTNQLSSVSSYLDLQGRISQQNAATANKVISDQKAQDKIAFDNLNQGILTKLTDFYQKDNTDNSEAGALADLKKKVAVYNATVSNTKSTIDAQITALNAQKAELYELEKNLYIQFFNASSDLEIKDDNYTGYTDSETVENARQALASKLQASLGTSDVISTKGYISQLNQLIQTISINEADYKLDELVGNASLSAEKRLDYLAQIDLIRRYANAFGISTGSLSTISIPSTTPVSQTVQKKLTILVPAHTTYRSSALPADVTAIVDGSTIATGGQITLDNNAGDTDKEFSVAVSVNLGATESKTVVFSWVNTTTNATVWSTSEEFSLTPESANAAYYETVGGNSFEKINIALGNVEKASQMITLLYGAPASDVRSMSSQVTREDFESTSSESIYSMYGNVPLDNLANRLSESDIENYRSQGHENIDKVIVVLGEIDATIKKLKEQSDILDSKVENEYFADNIVGLEKWYNAANEEINKLYSAWVDSPAVLQVNSWSGSNSQGDSLYVDNGETLYNQINSMVSSTNQTANTIADNAKTVENYSQQFENLVSNATTIKNEGQAVLNDANSLVDVSQVEVAENQDYTTKFSKILANTRTEGVNKDSLYQYFANPLEIVETSSGDVKELPKQIDYSWVLIFIVGLSAGALMTMLVGRLMLRKVSS